MSFRSVTLLIALALVVVLGLAACRGRATEAPGTETPGAEAQASETAAATPEPAVTVVFETAPPTLDATPEATLPAGGTPQATAGQTDGTAAAGTAPAATAGVAGSGDRAEFLADVTVPDGSNFTPGAAFVKTWQLRNNGSTTWNTGYALVYVRGDQLAGPASVPLESSVAPGQAVEISVNMVAPEATGGYTGFWQLRNDAGALFGVGQEANEPVYVQINVVPAGAGAGDGSPAPTGEAGATAVPGAIQVTGATLSVDQASLSGQCPQTFQFSGTIVSEGAGSVSYRVAAAADTPGFTFTLPEPSTGTFSGAGPRSFGVSYNMQFSGSVSGEMWLHVTAPNEVTSNRVRFSLTCETAPGAQ